MAWKPDRAPAPTCSAIPINALAWLANHLAAEGKGLRAGEIVLTGSLVKTVWLEAGDKVVMELSGLGTVSVSFA